MFATVSAKLYASAGAAVLIVMTLTTIDVLTQRELLRRTASIARATEAVRQVTAVRASLASARRYEQETVVALAHVDLMEMRAARCNAAMEDTFRALQELRDGIETEGRVEALESVDKDLHGYRRAFDETLAAVKSGLIGDASIAEGTMTDSRAQADSADKQLGQVAQALVERSDSARGAMAIASEKARSTSFFLLAVFATVGFIGSMLMRRAIVRPLDDAIRIARQVASGDLSPTAERRRSDEFGMLVQALQDMRERLQTLVSGVRHSADSLAEAANRIAARNLDLSTRTQSQATSLMAATGSVRHISQSVASSAESVQSVSSSAHAMFQAAERDGARVAQVVDTMQRIDSTTQRIRIITNLIDDVAMQTHMLGLNAAVEASNAGERGRGFGVVASGVRALAERCRAAAGEVKTLVGDATEHVDSGMTLARDAGEGVQALVAHAKKVSEHIEVIRRFALEQRDSIATISAAMGRIDAATRQNTGLVEQAAQDSGDLRIQAHRLSESVSAFRLS